MGLSDSFLRNTYYYIKPYIPRWLQLRLRRWVTLQKRSKFSNVWPINQNAAKPPVGWSGWPEEKRFALVLTHDVETATGQEKCIPLVALEESLGFRSSFNFVAEGYRVSAPLRNELGARGFEVGVHGIRHNENPFRSRNIFRGQAVKINKYLKEWGSVGFRCPCMYHNLNWIGELDIDYDSSTFDTDPFEPQPDGVKTIFPFWVSASNNSRHKGYVELPYTLPQDHTVFVLMGEKDIGIWEKKLDWIVKCGGMALLNVHPDYVSFGQEKRKVGEYPAEYYAEFLRYVKDEYEGLYWHVLAKDMARFWAENVQPQKR